MTYQPMPPPSSGYAAGPPRGPLGKPRGIGVCILLAIVTLGIYTFVWTWKTHDEIKSHSGIGVGGFECEIVELVPSERIVFRWGFVGPERTAGPRYDSLLTITLRAVPGGATALTLVHERLDDLAEAMPHVADKVRVGWELVLEKLAVTLEGTGRQGKSSGPDA